MASARNPYLGLQLGHLIELVERGLEQLLVAQLGVILGHKCGRHLLPCRLVRQEAKVLPLPAGVPRHLLPCRLVRQEAKVLLLPARIPRRVLPCRLVRQEAKALPLPARVPRHLLPCRLVRQEAKALLLPARVSVTPQRRRRLPTHTPHIVLTKRRRIAVKVQYRHLSSQVP